MPNWIKNIIIFFGVLVLCGGIYGCMWMTRESPTVVGDVNTTVWVSSVQIKNGLPPIPTKK